MRFNTDTRNLIIAGIRTGMGSERAARSARVDPATLWRWRQRGEQDQREGKRSAYAAFIDDFDTAEAESLAQLEVSMHEQAREDWRAGAWLLSRKRPAEYAKEPAAIDVLRKQAVEELLDFLQARAKPETFHEVLQLLSTWGNTELDPRVLPCPG